ncbi:hypothetical protein OG440_37315 [Streptomyces sp. NBC_00637]|uniref:hypothetical protein n=1 Tax=Streptomyces sp. NBC_00637 TaxID=2903667 RepID=UPI00324EE159
MTRLITACVLAAALIGPGAAWPSAAAVPARPAATSTPCTTVWEVTGKKVAVRRPAWNEGPVAKPDSPVDHSLRRGQRVTSCIVAIARTERGPAYRACGRHGSTWRVVPGGQIPQTCLKKVGGR